jgi:hypothetical protein
MNLALFDFDGTITTGDQKIRPASLAYRFRRG